MALGLFPQRVRFPSLGSYSRYVLRFMVIGGVCLLSAYFGRSSSMSDLVLLASLGGALTFLHYPTLGLIALLMASLVVPFSIGTSTQTPLNITILLIPALFALWLVDLIRRREIRFVPSRTTWPLIAFALVATISFLAGQLSWNYFARTAPLTAQVGGWAVMLFSVAVFLLAANQIKDVRWLEILTMLFLTIGSIYILDRIFMGAIGLSGVMNRLGSDGSMFWIWVTALAFGQLVFNRQLSRVMQLALAGLLVAVLAVGWFQARSWVSGWLPPFIAIGTIAGLRSRRLALILAIAGALSFLMIGHSVLSSLEAGEAYSIYTRDAAKDILLQQIYPQSPILGLGPANYYWYTPLYPILGWYVSFNSHNNYIDILLQTGILGLGCFLWIMGEVGRLGWSLRHAFADDFAQGYVYGCLGGLAGSLAACWLADWLVPFVYNIGLNGFRASVLAWLFWGGLVALQRITIQSSNHEEYSHNLGKGAMYE